MFQYSVIRRFRFTSMTTSCRFKCVPTFRGLLSIHIFMLLFRLIANSSVFMSDVTRECKTAIEIGRPFEGMCDNFLLFIIGRRTNKSFNLYYAKYYRIRQAPASHTLNSCNCSRRHLLAMHLRAIHQMFSKLLDCNFSLTIFLNSILAYDQAHARLSE